MHSSVRWSSSRASCRRFLACNRFRIVACLRLAEQSCLPTNNSSARRGEVRGVHYTRDSRTGWPWFASVRRSRNLVWLVRCSIICSNTTFSCIQCISHDKNWNWTNRFCSSCSMAVQSLYHQNFKWFLFKSNFDHFNINTICEVAKMLLHCACPDKNLQNIQWY